MKIDLSGCAGKIVYVGIDVHKATYSAVAVCEGQIALTVGSMPADPQKLIEFLRKRFPKSELRTAYEAGFSGFVLHRALTAADISSIVVHAASIAVAANDRVKTDKRDAAKIALHLARGMLRGIRIPTPEEELRRQLTRTRAQLVTERSRLANQIKGKLMQFGLIAPNDKRCMDARLLAEFKTLSLPYELAIAISALAALWEGVHSQVKVLDKEIDAQAKKEPKLEKIYRSVPGVGRLIARTMANELGDMSQFRSSRELYSFVGLTPTEHSSGPNERKGNITRQGPGQIRCLLVEAAWRAKTKDPELEQIYQRIMLTRGGKRAIVAVARRIIGRMRACLQNQVTYELNHNQKTA